AYKPNLESVEARLEVYKKNEAVFEKDIKILKHDVMFRDKAITELRQKFKQAEKERDHLKLTLEKFKGSFKNLIRVLDSQLCDKSKIGLGYDSQGFDSQVQTSSSAAVSVNTARPINTAYPRSTVNGVRPASYVFNKAHSHVRRPFNKFTTSKNSNFTQKVNTVKRNVTTIGPKAVVTNKKGNEANDVKASACWIWRPNQKVLDHVSRHNGASMNFKRFDYGNPQQELQKKGVIDSGCSRHITGNMSYLSKYEEIDGGYVSFGGDPKGEKIIDTECVVLSPKFKILDESQILLRVPRKNNMYSVDLRNVAPSGGLTYLFAKATLDVDGKFDGKADEGFFVGYSTNRKAFRVFNTRTRFVEENMHINFLEKKPSVVGTGPNWMFDIDTLTMSINYQLVFTRNQTNGSTGTKSNIDAGQAEKKTVPGLQYVLPPLLTFDSQGPKISKNEVANDVGKKSIEVPRKENKVQDPAKEGNKNNQEKNVRDQEEAPRKQFEQESERLFSQGEAANTNSTNILNIVSSPVNVVSSSFTTVDPGRERAQRNEFERLITVIRALVDGKKLIINEASIRFDLKLKDAEGTACLPNDTIFKKLARMGKETEVPSPSSEVPNKEGVPTTSDDPLPGGEDRMQLTELMNLCTNLTKQVGSTIRVESYEDKESLGDQEDVSKQGRMIDNIDQDVEITLVDETQGRMNGEEMFGVNDLDGDEVIVDATTVTTAATTPQISKDEHTLAQTLIEIKAAKPKAITTTATTTTTAVTRPKARGVIVQEPSEEVARNLEAHMKAEMEEEERIAREKDEANIVVIEQWDEVQAKINSDMELAQKLQTKEQEQLTDAEKARLFMEFLEKRKKFFARKREIEKRNKPPTKAHQRSLICIYLKNMDGWKPKNLKKKSFDEIQKLFNSAMKRVNTFVDMNT
nr:hypothetical protein [Tanacetum cinerariifolium]